MQEVPKSMIGVSGKLFVNSLLLREGILCSHGKNGIDLVVTLKRPRRNWSILVTTNLKPKKAGGKGKMALDWWVPAKNTADYVSCVDLSTLRAWIFKNDEFQKLSQQKAGGRYHLYMYTNKGVALRGKKQMKFDYEFEPYRIENRICRGVFDK
ncbi:MAG: hypothetical protein JW814_10520 [Candidatus Krumholzibacteriota bacterium]|nr:hypothetical protein [Candidatus Krumholzibacteriota bacterium]